MKTCRRCGVEKPLSDFHNRKDAKDGKQSSCKPCNISKVREWQSANPSDFKIYYSARDKQRNIPHTDLWYKKKATVYKVDWMLLKSLYEAANGVCQICGLKPDRWLVVDHCHTSGMVRGIICERCNQALGLFRDNPDTLLKAANYLNNNQIHASEAQLASAPDFLNRADS